MLSVQPWIQVAAEPCNPFASRLVFPRSLPLNVWYRPSRATATLEYSPLHVYMVLCSLVRWSTGITYPNAIIAGTETLRLADGPFKASVFVLIQHVYHTSYLRVVEQKGLRSTHKRSSPGRFDCLWQVSDFRCLPIDRRLVTAGCSPEHGSATGCSYNWIYDSVVGSPSTARSIFGHCSACSKSLDVHLRDIPLAGRARASACPYFEPDILMVAWQAVF